MNTLKKSRAKIARIDKKMAKLFRERMRESEKIADFKQKNNLPIADAKQEKRVIKNGVKSLSDAALKPYYLRFLQSLIDISKDFQEDILPKEV